MQDLLQIEETKQSSPDYFGPNALFPCSNCHANMTIHSDYIYTGHSKGFSIEFNCYFSQLLHSASSNTPLANLTIVRSHISAEVSARQPLGPNAITLASVVNVSPIGEKNKCEPSCEPPSILVCLLGGQTLCVKGSSRPSYKRH